jgi:hypothetical protein
MWALAHLLTDDCWLFRNGTRFVVVFGGITFAWLFFLFALRWGGRILLLLASLVMAILIPSSERNIVAAAESGAAAILRSSTLKLEEYRASGGQYPSVLALDKGDLPVRYYRFEYVPVRSPGTGSIDNYLMRARPLRYGCAPMPSFAVSRQGQFHITRENRDATLNDPILE